MQIYWQGEIKVADAKRNNEPVSVKIKKLLSQVSWDAEVRTMHNKVFEILEIVFNAAFY